MQALSPKKRRRRIYEFIKGSINLNGEPPTIAEIGREFNLSSPASVHQILVKLENVDGLIKRIPHVSRGIEIVN